MHISSLTLPLAAHEEAHSASLKRKRLVRATAVSLCGPLSAVALNWLVPQTAEIRNTVYQIWGMSLDREGFYRLVLLLCALWEFLRFLEARWDVPRQDKFIAQSPFHCAIYLALATFDIVGTKYQLTPQPFFPGPSQILETFLIETPYLFKNTLYSLRLFSAGFLLGVALGVGTGVLIGCFSRVRYWVYPVLKMTGVIPSVAWMPFALTMFPTPFAAAVFLIVICSWFPVASQTAFGIQTTPKVLYEAARTLGAPRRYLVWRVAIPHALPNIFSGISTACAGSFTCLVIAEMMGQPGGLGYYINVVKVWSAYYKVFAAILIMAVQFSLILAMLNIVRARVLRWQEGQFQ